LDLHVSGSAKSPRVSWDRQAMVARLSGKASQALAEQRAKLEADAREAARQALLSRFGVAGDSSAPKLPGTGTAARDSVQSAARTLLRSFFGRKQSKPPAGTPAPPAPAPEPAADTTAHR